METITPQMMAEYRATARRRAEERRSAREQRFTRAWEVARAAADLLKTKYHAQRVAVFGSLLHAERFTEWSDIDLAVWGVEGVDYLEAVADLQDLSEFKIDLVAIPYARTSLLSSIEKEGVDL